MANPLNYRNDSGSIRSVGTSDLTNTTFIVASWGRNEYHAKIVEFNGTKFRVGNQRFNEDGTEIDADIVWSHATLAGGATFDGSFNPEAFFRWYFNTTTPNWMRCHFVSNQHSLGNTEIIKRLRKYGQF